MSFPLCHCLGRYKWGFIGVIGELSRTTCAFNPEVVVVLVGFVFVSFWKMFIDLVASAISTIVLDILVFLMALELGTVLRSYDSIAIILMDVIIFIVLKALIIIIVVNPTDIVAVFDVMALLVVHDVYVMFSLLWLLL